MKEKWDYVFAIVDGKNVEGTVLQVEEGYYVINSSEGGLEEIPFQCVMD